MNAENDIAKTLSIDTSSSRSKRLKRILLLLVVAVIAGVVILGFLRSSSSNNGVKYQTQKAERGDLTVSVTATGTLEPTNHVEVGSELSGIIETVEVDYNDAVKVDQVLARLDPEKLQAQVIKSEAALASAKANVLQAEANVLETSNELDRLTQLAQKTDNKAVSQHDLDAAKAAFKRAQAAKASARAQVSEAVANLDSNRTDLGKSVIRSPINGIVLTREVEPGQTVAASFQAPILFTLAETLTHMELHVDVDEADVGQVKEGQDAIFTVDAYSDLNFQAVVKQVRYGAQTVDGVVTYETVLRVDNTDLMLRPGMTATSEITVKKVENIVLVPNTALRFSPPIQHMKQPAPNQSFLSKLIPRPPRRQRTQQSSEGKPGGKSGRVWILREGRPVPILITHGATDGTMTEVASGDITPGMDLLVDIEESGK